MALLCGLTGKWRCAIPIKEHLCNTEGCPSFGTVEEHFFHVSAPEPVCGGCGKTKQQMISRFNSPFTGAITHRYKDTRLENSHGDGAHWVYERNTPDGKPKATYIETFQQQREYCKREGLVPPTQAGPVEISSDGRSMTSVGLPGCEV